MQVIPPGTYRINPLLFTVTVTDATDIPPGKIGVVEARDGKPLPAGRIIARARRMRLLPGRRRRS